MSHSGIELFANNPSYHTPADTPTALIFRIPGLRSFWYHSSFICGLLRRSRRLAVRGEFNEIVHAEAGLTYMRHIERAGGKFHVAGLRHLDTIPGPAVFVANHMSLCETFVLAPMIVARKGKNSFVIKESLTRYPVFGPIVRSTTPITVTRKRPREDFQQVMRQGEELLEQGRCVTIFPQNQRRQYFRSTEFNTLGAKLSTRAGVPLIPVALRTDFLEPGKLIVDLGRIHPERPLCFEFGSPIPPGVDTRTKHQQVLEFIRSRLRQWNIPCMD